MSGNSNITYKNLPSVKKKLEVFKNLYDSRINEIVKITNGSNYPKTINFFIKTIKKVELLKSSINKCLENEEFYSANILLRSLLEHNIVAFYVWIKFNEDRNDSCVENYYKVYSLSEEIKQEGFKLKIEGIKSNIIDNNSLSKLKSRMSILNDKEQKDIDKIHEIGNQFDIHKVFNYLSNKLKDDHAFKPYIEDVIFNNLLEYNLLSSFVHGGPYSEKYNFLKHDIEKIEFIPIHSLISLTQCLFQILSLEIPEYKQILKNSINPKDNGTD